MWRRLALSHPDSELRCSTDGLNAAAGMRRNAVFVF
jgi:hypothetical protein